MRRPRSIARCCTGPYAGGRRQRRATGLVRDNVNRADQPDAPCLADQRMVGKRLQLLLQIWPDLPDLGEDVPLLVDFQGLDGDRCGYGVSGVGEAVREIAELSGVPGYGVSDLFADDRRGDRQIGGRQRLRHRHDVGLYAEGFAAEHISGAAEPADHLIGNEQDVVPTQHLLNAGKIVARRDDDAARAIHGFCDEGGDRVRSFANDHLLEIADQPVDEGLLALARQAEQVMARAVGPEHATDRRSNRWRAPGRLPSHYLFGLPGESEQAFVDRLVGNLEQMIVREGPDTIAAFIAEPVNGAGGVIVPPRDSFPRIGGAASVRHPAIADEVICGFGRTGTCSARNLRHKARHGDGGEGAVFRLSADLRDDHQRRDR